MKKIIFLLGAGILLLAASKNEINADTPLKGSWQVVRAQYGKGAMKARTEDESTIKMFTGTRWSAAFFSKERKTFDGACGGSYTIKGDQYLETLEYYPWDKEAVGKTFTFTLKMENGMLHQLGYIEYKGDTKYLIDEWYTRID